MFLPDTPFRPFLATVGLNYFESFRNYGFLTFECYMCPVVFKYLIDLLFMLLIHQVILSS